MSESLNGIKAEIFELESKLQNVGNPPDSAPEMLDATNALRVCEYLTSVDLIKSDLIRAYAKYSANLESLVRDALQIQKSMNAILQNTPKRSSKKPQRKSSTTKSRKTSQRKSSTKKSRKTSQKRKSSKKPIVKKPRKKTIRKTRRKSTKN